MSLDDLQRTTQLLLLSGARIDEVNVVRQHLSLIKGGGLAAMAIPAAVFSLILSDVVGDPIESIASGPTASVTMDVARALAILDKYQLTESVPSSVSQHLKGASRDPRGSVSAEVNLIVGSNRFAASAARDSASELGFQTLVLTNFLQGEAREVGEVVAALARQVLHYGEPLATPACLVLGGETTVHVTGDGVGGRNQELALAAAIALEGYRRVLVSAFGTDGVDGPTPAAGAIVSGKTCAEAREAGMDPTEYLRRNDSHTLLKAVNADLRTGPTGTNVNDLVLVLCYDS